MKAGSRSGPRTRCLAAAIAAACGCLSAHAATITVTTGGDSGGPTTCTLRQAIDSANSDGALPGSSCVAGDGADTIQFDPSLANSTITLGGARLPIVTDVTVIGSGQIIDANHASRVFSLGQLNEHHIVALSDLTLRNGDAGAYSGGAIYAKGVELTLQNVTISGNSAASGGGIFASGSALTLTQSSVSGNTATGQGTGNITGGVQSVSNTSLTLDRVAITGNSATYGTGANIVVGGLYDAGSVVSITDSIISGNSASTPAATDNCYTTGGIQSGSVSFSMTRSTIANNSASGPASLAGSMTVTGGIYLSGTLSVDLHDITVAQNSASAHHTISYDAVGGLRARVYAGSAPLSNVTISANAAHALDADAVAVGGVMLDGIDMNNSIDSGNTGGAAPDLALPSGGTLRFNLLGYAAEPTQAGNGNRFADDPRLAPFANNGGPTPTRALLPDSPAINNGDSTLVAAGDTTDQRGAGFPRIIGSAVDIGAFEFAGSEREALIGLYLATNGDGWTDNSGWCNGACPASGVPTFNAPGTECSWHGVTCDVPTGTHVVQIDLSSNNLVGGPLPDLTWLTQLISLDLHSNAIGGPLPDLHALTQLQVYALPENRFTGPIPSNIASWPALIEFQVSDNNLSGGLPSLTGASQLKDFEAARDGLSGPIPSLTGLSQLSYIDLQSNALTGPLPSLVDQTSLFVLSVNDNALSGPLPPLGAFFQLNVIDVDTNQFTGSVPSLAGLGQLRYASFASNQLTGGFPDISGTGSMGVLDISSNQLSGPLPDLSGNSGLNLLYVQSNNFSGVLPPPPKNLAPSFSALCPNLLSLAPGPNDNAWNLATGQTPWWGPHGGGCDGVASGDFELLGNASFERGIANWHIGGGTCLWETASEGTLTGSYGHWAAPAPVDGSLVLISDNANVGDCLLYQDVTVPAGVSSASFSAAVGYNVAPPWGDGCAVDVSVTTPAGAEIAPYVTLNGPASVPLTQYAPIAFPVQSGDVLRIALHAVNRCTLGATGIVVDNVELSLH